MLPGCVKPKLHHVNHIPVHLGRHQVNLACFAPERHHQLAKRALRDIYRHMEVALAVRNAKAMLELLQDETTFKDSHLRGTLRSLERHDPGMEFLHGAVEGVAHVQRSICAATPKGTWSRRDLLTWYEHGVLAMGKAVYFYFVPDARFFVLVEKCRRVNNGWEITPALAMLGLRNIRAAIAYMKDDELLRPCIPAW